MGSSSLKLGQVLLFSFLFSCVFSSSHASVIKRTEPVECRQKWAQLAQSLTDMDDFKEALIPFVHAAADAYNFESTRELEKPVDGWTLILEKTPKWGMNALAFQNDEDPTLIMIAIRGVRSFRSIMDLCALWWLVSRHPNEKLCAFIFSEDRLNYFQQLMDFVSEVDEVIPEPHCKIFIGHSLGGTLAALASANSNGEAPAVTTGVVGAYTAAKWLGLPLDQWSSVYSFYIDCDIATVMPVSWTNQTGTLCALHDENRPGLCYSCDECNQLDVSSLIEAIRLPCYLCLRGLHRLSHYVDVIPELTTAPSCQNAGI